jgi:hypothetical protein
LAVNDLVVVAQRQVRSLSLLAPAGLMTLPQVCACVMSCLLLV